MELQSFLAALEERIARYDLLCHPYYKAWTAGQLTRDDLREYASDYYHHVAAFPAYLSALHSRLDDGEGMGAARDQVREREPLPEVRELIGEFRRVAREGSTAEALAAFYAYESQVPRVAKAKADGLAERYGADAKTCGYFKLHQFADVEHSHVWHELLSAEIAAHRGEAEAALDAAETAAKSLWHALDGMEARRTAVAA